MECKIAAVVLALDLCTMPLLANGAEQLPALALDVAQPVDRLHGLNV
jgi:hypothetical protein